MNITERVTKLLEEIPQTRNNDNLLIAYVIKEEYGVSNLFDIALMTNANIYESIRRTRQKAMELNPMLRPEQKVYEERMKKEQKVRKEMGRL